MLQFQGALRTLDGPSDASWRLDDAPKTKFLALGAALKSRGGLFQRRLTIHQQTPDERSAGRTNGLLRPSELLVAFE
jgi:hypothetical protein